MSLTDIWVNTFGIEPQIAKLCAEVLVECKDKFDSIDEIASINQLKVLSAMQKNRLSESHFAYTTGYGYNDAGRDTLESIYADVFHTEAALVRPQIVSGTHALSVALFGNLRHGDTLLCVTGAPYDTLQGVIGIRETAGSLSEHGIYYKQTELTEDGMLDFEAVKTALEDGVKLVSIQRSKGYKWRKSLSVTDIKDAIDFIRSIDKDVIIMVDNCYGEFVETIEPSDVGADLVVGSLIKNPGGGLAPVGGYIAGKRKYVENAAYRLTAPGLGAEVGPGLGVTPKMIQGLFIAPTVTAAAVKTAVYAAAVCERLGFETLPHSKDIRADIVQAIKLGNPEAVTAFCRGIQAAAPVDAFVTPEGWDMPGYDCPVIMAAGAFTSGASIELSADAPMREPFIVYMQGALTFEHGKYGVVKAVNELQKRR